MNGNRFKSIKQHLFVICSNKNLLLKKIEFIFLKFFFFIYIRAMYKMSMTENFQILSTKNKFYVDIT